MLGFYFVGKYFGFSSTFVKAKSFNFMYLKLGSLLELMEESLSLEVDGLLESNC